MVLKCPAKCSQVKARIGVQQEAGVGGQVGEGRCDGNIVLLLDDDILMAVPRL